MQLPSPPPPSSSPSPSPSPSPLPFSPPSTHLLGLAPPSMNLDLDSHDDWELISRLHSHDVSHNQTSSVLIKRIRAPVDTVWSIVRRFDQPQLYKPFVQRCKMQGEMKVGCIREVYVVSGLPATTSTERLDTLDDENHITTYTILGGDHRLKNYRSVISLHAESMDEKPGTLVIKSYVVDIPDGNTKEDTQLFVEALIKCNLKSLADVCERLVI